MTLCRESKCVKITFLSPHYTIISYTTCEYNTLVLGGCGDTEIYAWHNFARSHETSYSFHSKIESIKPKTLKFPKSTKPFKDKYYFTNGSRCKACKVTKEAFPGIEYQYRALLLTFQVIYLLTPFIATYKVLYSNTGCVRKFYMKYWSTSA